MFYENVYNIHLSALLVLFCFIWWKIAFSWINLSLKHVLCSVFVFFSFYHVGNFQACTFYHEEFFLEVEKVCLSKTLGAFSLCLQTWCVQFLYFLCLSFRIFQACTFTQKLLVDLPWKWRMLARWFLLDPLENEELCLGEFWLTQTM